MTDMRKEAVRFGVVEVTADKLWALKRSVRSLATECAASWSAPAPDSMSRRHST
jgi:hypothetical protein